MGSRERPHGSKHVSTSARRVAKPAQGGGTLAPPRSAVQAVPAASAMAAVSGDDPYRLEPDARVLLAVADLHHLVTGAPREDAHAVFGGGAWRVRYRGLEVGVLPEFPEFGDLEGLLRHWALSL